MGRGFESLQPHHLSFKKEVMTVNHENEWEKYLEDNFSMVHVANTIWNCARCNAQKTYKRMGYLKLNSDDNSIYCYKCAKEISEAVTSGES